MGISRLTAMVIATNYPDDILVASGGTDEKYAGFIYLMRDGNIHSVQVSTNARYDSAVEAEAAMNDLCKELCTWYDCESATVNINSK